MIFNIKNRNKVIAKIVSTGVDRCPFTIASVYDFSFDFLSSNAILSDWLVNRRSILGRANMSTLLKQAGVYTIYDYVRVSKCISLNDTFWVSEENSNLSWEDVSPYSNSFNKIYSDISCGLLGFNGRVLSSPSPELSTRGISLKCWLRRDNKITLVKSAGGINELEYSNCFSEYFASQLSEFMHLSSFVNYSLVKRGDMLASSCNLFTSEDFGFKPMRGLNVFDCGDLISDLQLLRTLGISDNIYREMLVLDSLIFNVDRHTENYGFLVNNDTGSLVSMSPIFDNDNSLFNRIGLVGRKSEDIMYDVSCLFPTTYSGTFVEQAKLCMTPALLDKVNLVRQSFEFKQHPIYKVNEERLRRMSKIVRWQASRILNACGDK